MPPGKFVTLQKIHQYLFEDIYDFAEQIQTVNLSKSIFRFAPMMYLYVSLENIDKMPQSDFDAIVENMSR